MNFASIEMSDFELDMSQFEVPALDISNFELDMSQFEVPALVMPDFELPDIANFEMLPIPEFEFTDIADLSLQMEELDLSLSNSTSRNI